MFEEANCHNLTLPDLNRSMDKINKLLMPQTEPLTILMPNPLAYSCRRYCIEFCNPYAIIKNKNKSFKINNLPQKRQKQADRIGTEFVTTETQVF